MKERWKVGERLGIDRTSLLNDTRNGVKCPPVLDGRDNFPVSWQREQDR